MTPREKSDIIFMVGATAVAVLLGIGVYLFWPG